MKIWDNELLNDAIQIRYKWPKWKYFKRFNEKKNKTKQKNFKTDFNKMVI